MDIHDVKHLATLARLDIPEEEQRALLADLQAILGYIDQVTEAPVSLGEDRAPEHRNRFREDVVASAASPENTELLLSQAVATQDGFVKVRKIL